MYGHIAYKAAFRLRKPVFVYCYKLNLEQQNLLINVEIEIKKDILGKSILCTFNSFLFTFKNSLSTTFWIIKF